VLVFSHITWAFNQVTRAVDKEKFVWGMSQQKSFYNLKQWVCSSQLLSLPDLRHTFEIETDPLDYDMGIILTQHGHLVAFHSETPSDVFHKYPTYDKEM
jgi:hypothetical protein